MIAEKLGKYAFEVMDEMPYWEFRLWLAMDKAIEMQEQQIKSKVRLSKALKG